MTPMRPHHTLCIVVTLALGGGVSATLAAQTPAPVRNIDSLLARMTLEEKLGQLNQLSVRSEEHTSELQSQSNLVCRLLLEKKKHTIAERSLQPTARVS